jgi:hypothetical protein
MVLIMVGREMRYLQDMETFTMDPGNSKLSLAALLAVKPAGALWGISG